LKTISLRAGRFALTGVAAAAMGLLGSNAHALALGRVAVQSALGEALHAEVDVTSLTPEEAGSLRVRIAPPDAYRAAGVDYNAVLPGTQAVLQRRADGRAVLQISSDRAVQEPFIDVILEITWSSGRLVREFTLLIDPPSSRQAQAPAPAVAPSISAAPAPAPVAAAPAAPSAPAAETARPAPERRAAPQRPAVTAPSEAAAPRAAPATSGDEYRVRNGDTLSSIAARTQRPGASLDQMLVALFRGNAQAFMGENMNRLKAGSVLTVPSAEAAQQISATEARQVIQAQSADFGSYRQRLAGAAPEAKTEAPARQASGKVQAAVEDRKQATATTPDKLKLSQGALKASGPEARVSKETEKKEAAARVAELARNVEELKKLSSAASATAAKAPAGPAAASAAAPTAAPKVPSPTIVAAAPPAPPPTPMPAPAPKPAAAPASAPAAAASTAVAVAPTAALQSPPAPPAAATPPKPVPKPAPKPAAPEPEEPGLLASLLDNPLVLPIAGVLVALLAGLGFYRLRSKTKKESGETSFLESRLQPDSFFGASGGQRIDTRDASGASSSMSYSLSQLDAIGDVDPVAEADVYLAYGRDLQAEEILKEAMRANPDRLAIRTKLLEVYAKRRDTKGFELLATQLYSLTRGEGEDWGKAQEMGRQVDPENALYQPGGKPAEAAQMGDRMVEPLGASTMPQSVMPAPAIDLGAVAESPVDLDLDLDTPAPVSMPAPSAPEVTRPFAAPSPAVQDMSFDLPPVAPMEAERPASPAMDFDLSGLTLDLNAPAAPATPAAAAAPHASGYGDLELPQVPSEPAFDATPAAEGGGDPLARKLELAEEFRQIGDMEGARDLLEEVIAKAQGALRLRAESMLGDLT